MVLTNVKKTHKIVCARELSKRKAERRGEPLDLT
jgi:hypothetical protein